MSAADGDWDLLDDSDSLGVLSLESDCEEPSSPLSAGASAVIEAAEEQPGPEFGQLQDLLSSVVASAQLAGSAPVDAPLTHASHGPAPDSTTPDCPDTTRPPGPEPTTDDVDDAALAAAAGKPASEAAASPASPTSTSLQPLANLHVLLLQLLLGAAATAVVAAVLLLLVAPGGRGTAPIAVPIPAPHQHQQPPWLSTGRALPPASAVEGFPRLQELWALALASHSTPAHINATLSRLVLMAQHKRARALQAQLQQLDASSSRKAPLAGAARQPWTNSTCASSAPVNKPHAAAGSGSAPWSNGSSLATCVNVWSRMLFRPLQQLMLPAARQPMLPSARPAGGPAPTHSNSTCCAAATAARATAGADTPNTHPGAAATGATPMSTRAFLNATAGSAAQAAGAASRGVALQMGSCVAAMAAAAVRSGSSAWQRITRPSKPVPALYRPAPPCLMVVVPNRQQAQRPALQASSLVKAVPALYRPAPPCLMVVRGQKPAAPAGGGLTLPMLAPLVFAAPPATTAAGTRSAVAAAVVRGAAANKSSTCRSSNKEVADPGSSSSRFGQFSLLPMARGKDAAEAGSAPGGLTLPMLPPIAAVGMPGASGGLTLPMLPPVMCHTCGTNLQLLPARSSKRPVPATTAAAAAAAATVPTAKAGKGTVVSAMHGQERGGALVSPADEPPTCLAPAPSTCPAPNKRRVASATKATAAQKNATANQHSDRSSKHNATSATSSTKGVWVSSWPSPPVLLPSPVKPAKAPAAAATTAAPVPRQPPPVAPRQLGSASALSSKLHKLAAAADRLQQPVKQLMHLLSAASKRSLQCAPAAVPAGGTSAATFSFHLSASAGGHRRALYSDAYAANSAAYAAAAELLAAASAVEDSADAAAQQTFRRGYAAPLPAQMERALQHQCWAVGLAHRALHVAVGAAVFSSAPSGPKAAPISTSQPAPAPAAAFPAAAASKAGSQLGSSAIPLGPAGALQAASSLSVAPPGPLLPLQFQLAGGSTSRRLAPASRLGSSALAAPAKAAGVGIGGAAKLNAGWDRHSAWQVAQLAAEAGKAEGRLQQACQQLLLPSEAVAVAV